MSWTGPTTGIHLSGRDSSCAPVTSQSISVNWVPGTCVAGDRSVTPRLRMYGVQVDDATWAMGFAEDGCTPLTESEQRLTFGPFGERPDCTGGVTEDTRWGTSAPFEYVAYDVHGVPLEDGRVQYLDAITKDGTDWDFWLLPASLRAAGVPMLRSTCIPEHRTYTSFYYTRRWYTPAGGIRISSRDMLVNSPALSYAEGIDVLQLPSGRWLMLMGQFTTFIDDAVDITTNTLSYGELRELCGDGQCSLCDIICYVADDAEFQSNVLGPVRVVDGKYALPEAELPVLGTTARLFVGAPSGVIVGTDLYVYYAFGPTFDFDDRDGAPPPESQEAQPCPVGTIGGDVTGVGDYTSSRDAYAQAVGSFRSGIAVKRIALADLEAHFDAYYDYEIDGYNFGDYLTRNHLWDYLLDLWDWDVTVPGTLLGRVRVWVEPNPTHTVDGNADAESFDDAMCVGAGKMIDPDAVTCATTGALSLFFAYSACVTLGTGGGLWRATALSAGVEFNDGDGAHVVTELGKDFSAVVDWGTDGTGSWTSPDHLADADNTRQFLNPSAIEMPDGTWRVYSQGGLDFVQMNRFDGTSGDLGCT